jgi:NADPH:quinone reductase-like Zn-dependent oxidoreductase
VGTWLYALLKMMNYGIGDQARCFAVREMIYILQYDAAIAAGEERGGSTIDLLARRIVELVLSRFVSQSFVMFMAKLNKQDLTVMCELMEDGKVTPVIDRRYRLSEVPHAIQYLHAESAGSRGTSFTTPLWLA